MKLDIYLINPGSFNHIFNNLLELDNPVQN